MSISRSSHTSASSSCPGRARSSRTATTARRLVRGFAVLAATALLAPIVALSAQAAPVAPAETTAPAASAGSAATGLTVEGRTAPADIENLTAPVFAWQPPVQARLIAGDQTPDQSAYRLVVASSAEAAAVGAGDVWDSGRVESTQSTAVPYAGPALTAGSKYWYSVTTWSGSGVESGWAEPSGFGTALGSSWSDADPIWAPKAEQSGGWGDFSYTGTFNIQQGNATLSFRVQDSGNYYMWQFRGAGQLAPHRWVGGAYTQLKTVELGHPLSVNQDYRFRIEARGSTITTYLDDVLVDTTVDDTFATGTIGFRTGGGERTNFDDLKVVAPDGTTLYQNDFSAPSTDFPCGTVASGVLSVGSSKQCSIDRWGDYTLSFDVAISEIAQGVVFRAVDEKNFYMWQFRADNSTLVPHVNKNNVFTAMPAVPLGTTISTGRSYPVRIEAYGSTITTYFDGALIDTRTDTTYPTGKIGVRNGSSETGRIADLTVTSSSGSVVYANDFTSNADLPCGTASSNVLTVPKGALCLRGVVNNDWIFTRGQVDVPDRDIQWATLSATGSSPKPTRQYVYKAYVNGQFVGLGPTQSVGAETRYDGYDVTDLITKGETNALGAVLYTTVDQRFLAELVIHFTDGTEQTFGTGEDWTTLNGAAVYPAAGSSGTSYFTAPKENTVASEYPFGFAEAGFDDSEWKAAQVKAPFAQLEATPTAKVEQQYPAPVSIVDKGDGDYFIDFGRAWVGGIRLSVDGTAGQVLDVRYGEITSAPNTVKYALSTGNNYQDKWTLKDGGQTLETWGIRVFRYVEILGASEPITAENLQAVALVYPFDRDAARFTSSDDNLNQVWQLSKNTIEMANVNLYVDSWTRERGAYEADAYVQQTASSYLSSDLTLGDYSMDYLLSNRTWPTEWPLYAIRSVRDSWWNTGTTDQIVAQYDKLVATLPTRWLDPTTGLVKKDPGTGNGNDRDIVDWPTNERDGYVFTQYNTVINALSYRTFRDMQEMATAIGRTDDATGFGATADRLYTAINEKMYDPITGAYRDGLNNDGTPIDHFALHATAFSLAFGLADEEQAAKGAEYIGTKGMACSVYCAGFLLDGLYAGGNGDIAMSLLTSTDLRSWMNMITVGAGATMEAWDLSLKGNTSYSHPWGAAPAYVVPRGMFGISPTSPGYGSFSVKPQPGGVATASITVPTAAGSIGAAFSARGESSLDEAVRVPANTTATVSIPVGDAKHDTVYLDGVATSATPVGGYLQLDAVPSGCHVLSTQAGRAASENPALSTLCPDGFVTPDTTAPEVSATAALTGIPGERLVTVTAVDPGVGNGTGTDVASIDYRVDLSDDWTAYTAPVSVDASLHTLSFRATDAAGNVSETGEIVLPGGTLAPAEIQAGGSVDLELQGFEAGDALAIELHSEPVPLATATAGLDGSLSQPVIIPVGSELGLHAVVITGESGRVASLPVVITPADGGIDPGDGGGPGEGTPGNGGAPADPGDGAEAGSLSDTGFPMTPWLLGGVLLCLLGLGLYGVMKRPRRS